MSIRASVLRYYEDIAEDYNDRFNNPRINFMRSVEKMVLLDNLKPGMILDIGCGTGEQSLFLAKKGYRVLSIDISIEMIKRASDRIKEAEIENNPSLIIASAEALPFRDKSFDGLISIFGVFNHIPRANYAFRETHRVLKKGGRAVFTVVNRWNLTWWINALLRCKGSWLLSSLKSKEYIVNGLWTYYFSKNELKNMLGRMGFKVRIGCMLLLIYPFNTNDLLFYENLFIRFENRVRWNNPFNSLGYYLIARLEKQ